jgi:3-oxoacyl-[acyl-carrier protein] reductase
MDLELQGDAALVTASSAGLGKASARALAREGVDVAMNGRDEDRLDAAVEDVRTDAEGDVIGIVGDVSVAADTERLVAATVDAFDGLDHLVTSAGGPPSGPFLDTDDEDWQATFDTLVMSVVRLAREAEPYLSEGDRPGSIVTITSRTVKEAAENLVLSNAVRMSVIGLEKTLSEEFAPDVRANAVLPGPHETDRIEEILEQGVERGDYESYEAGLAARSADIPLERIGDPMELGNTVAFLCSPAAGYINGAAVGIDGGQSASNL